MPTAGDIVLSFQLPERDDTITYPTLSPGEYSIRDLVLGPGHYYLVTKAQFYNWPDVLSGDMMRNEVHGVSMMPWDFFAGRVCEMQVIVQDDPTNSLQLPLKLSLLSQACAQYYDGELITLRFYRPNWFPMRMTGRVRGFVVHEETWPFGYVTVDIQFQAVHPTLLDDDLTYAYATLVPGTVTTPGRTYPRDYDVVTLVPWASNGWQYLAAGGSLQPQGLAYITVEGTFPVAPVIYINGPVTDPAITHLESGAQVAFDIDLTQYDQLIVDMGAGTVYMNGGNRYNTLIPGSRFFTMPPGSNTIRYNGTTTGSVIAVQWRSAWL